MLIRHFIPIALLFLVVACAIANLGGVPIAPIAIITVVGEFLIALQLEDNRLADFLAELVHAFKGDHHHTLHHR